MSIFRKSEYGDGGIVIACIFYVIWSKWFIFCGTINICWLSIASVAEHAKKIGDNFHFYPISKIVLYRDIAAGYT